MIAGQKSAAHTFQTLLQECRRFPEAALWETHSLFGKAKYMSTQYLRKGTQRAALSSWLIDLIEDSFERFVQQKFQAVLQALLNQMRGSYLARVIP